MRSRTLVNLNYLLNTIYALDKSTTCLTPGMPLSWSWWTVSPSTACLLLSEIGPISTCCDIPRDKRGGVFFLYSLVFNYYSYIYLYFQGACCMASCACVGWVVFIIGCAHTRLIHMMQYNYASIWNVYTIRTYDEDELCCIMRVLGWGCIHCMMCPPPCYAYDDVQLRLHFLYYIQKF